MSSKRATGLRIGLFLVLALCTGAFVSYFVHRSPPASRSSSSQTQPVSAEYPTLRLIEYNINNEQDCLLDDPALQKTRMERLGRYVIDNAVDIATFPEMRNWRYDGDNDLVRPNNIDEAQYLENYFAQNNYPMERVDTFPNPDRNSFRVVTFSRFASVPNTKNYFTFPSNEHPRDSNYITLQTSLGPIHLFSIHTHYQVAEQHVAYLNTLLAERFGTDPTRVIVSGDFNASAAGSAMTTHLQTYPLLADGGMVDKMTAHTTTVFTPTSRELSGDIADGFCGGERDQNHSILRVDIRLKDGIAPPNPVPVRIAANTANPTATITQTPTAAASVTATATPTLTITPTITPTQTPSVTPTPTITLTPTRSPTPTPTVTSTPTPTHTVTPTATPTVTATPSPTFTPTMTRAPTLTPTYAPPTMTPTPIVKVIVITHSPTPTTRSIAQTTVPNTGSTAVNSPPLIRAGFEIPLALIAIPILIVAIGLIL